MKKGIGIVLAVVWLAACAPALEQQYLERGSSEVALPDIIANPEAFKGRLVILGGRIVGVTATERTLRIEAVSLPVDAEGRLERGEVGDGRFIALYPKSMGSFDAETYRPGERITLAGVFTGFQPGRFDGMSYLYPVFEIQDLHLVTEGPIRYEPYPFEDPYLGPSSTVREPFWKDRPGPPGR